MRYPAFVTRGGGGGERFFLPSGRGCVWEIYDGDLPLSASLNFLSFFQQCGENLSPHDISKIINSFRISLARCNFIAEYIRT